MKILGVLSESQQMPGILYALNRMGHEIEMYPKPTEEIEQEEEQQKNLEEHLKKNKYAFIISNSFKCAIARVTNRLEVKYAVWCMDSPAYNTWMPEARYDNCYLFHFDRQEYELKKKSGYHNVYYLPLAADIVGSGQLVITDEEIKKYACDMSFVGSLYTQNFYDYVIQRFALDIQEQFTDIIEKSAFVWDGQERLHLPPHLVQTVLDTAPDIYDQVYQMPDEYYIRTFFMGRKLSNVERTLLMELLAQRYDIHLYTRATERVPDGVRRFPEVSAANEALKVYYSSKINLNITLRSIAGGVPARVYEIMSMGGFVLSNWQEEISELFEEDKEIVTYKTPEELIDKADFYLRHDTERIRIGLNGYQRAKKDYTYEQQIGKIISILYPSP